MTQFSTREVPWMKLGKLIDAPVTAKEAAKLGGLDFTVSLQPVGVLVKDTTDPTYAAMFPNAKTKNGTFRMIPSRYAVTADDNGDFMGFVSSNKYHSLQYSDAFNFMDAVNPRYVAAGGLRSRRQGFMVVEMSNVETVGVLNGADPHRLYAVLRTSHDCSRATEVSVMMLRGRCMNQLTLQSFSKDAPYRWSIKHTSSQTAKLAEAQKSLKNIGAYVKWYGNRAEELANKTIAVDQADKILRQVITKPTGKTTQVDEKYEQRINQVLDLFLGCDEVGYPDNGWGLVNAVSEYYEWHRAGGTPESRFVGALQGQTHGAINRTMNLVLAA